MCSIGGLNTLLATMYTFLFFGGLGVNCDGAVGAVTTSAFNILYVRSGGSTVQR